MKEQKQTNLTLNEKTNYLTEMKLNKYLVQKRNEGGITLIALVVTIIILLILSGVTLGLLLSDGGLIDKTKQAIAEHEKAQEKEQEELGEAAGMMSNLIDGLGGTGGKKPDIPQKDPISKEDSFVGYYADIEGDGTVDGIIYADLAVGNTGSGQWGNGNETYTIPSPSDGEYSLEDLKDYYVIDENPTDYGFGEGKVLSPIKPKDTKKQRFYLMALKDVEIGGFAFWYYSAYDNNDGNGITNYSEVTKTEFGAGRKNSETMKTKWKNSAYGEQNGGSTEDIWEIVEKEIDKGWFIPSKEEWLAFAGELGAEYGKNVWMDYYWTSSLYNSLKAWLICFSGNDISAFDINYFDGEIGLVDYMQYRLSTTF